MKKYAYSLAILLLPVMLSAQQESDTKIAHMRLASCQFPISDQISVNADWILKQMIEAADSGIRVVHFPECALSGYPGVDFIFQSFYNARQKPGGIHPKIMPVTAQTRAATNHFYMSLTNSSSPSSWPCHFITPDGLVEGILEVDKPGILFSDVLLMEGKLSSGDAPDDPRYSNQNSL